MEQSGVLGARLATHAAQGRFGKEAVDAAERYSVRGGKTAREVAEQLKIDELRTAGVPILNVRNPIGKARIHLMPPGYVRP